jgi:predicted transcriptional regulator YheO
MNVSLQKYLPLVDFLAEVLGKDAEVVLHDVADVGSSVVAIRNGHISGREVGAPATNVVLRIIKDGSEKDMDFIANYRGISTFGKPLRSSTYLIHDDDRRLIGVLCVNLDLGQFERFRDYLDSILRLPQSPDLESTVECFSGSVEELAYASIQAVVKENGGELQRLSQDKKKEIVRRLNDDGVFLLKGAISRVASALDVSEPTVYRYLNGIKKEGIPDLRSADPKA